MAKRRTTVDKITPPKPRETAPKKVFKKKAKGFVEGIAKTCFGYNYKTTIVRNRPRKAELAYKIKILGKGGTQSLTRFNQEIAKRAAHHYTLSFSGKINPRTAKEELYIDLVLFRESNLEASEPSSIRHFIKAYLDKPQHHEDEEEDD